LVDINQIRPKFVVIPRECVLKDAAFGLTKNDPHPLETRYALLGMRAMIIAV